MYIRNALMSGFALPAICFAMADEGEPLGIIELGQNLDEVEKPEELPAGPYVGEIQSVELKTSDKGNQYFAVKFRIAPDQIPADVADSFDDGAVLFWNRQIVPKEGDRRALYNLKRFVTALGLDANTTAIDPNDWMGCTARLNVTMGTWQSEKRAEIKSIESAEKSAPAATRGKPSAAATKPAGKRRGR